MLRSTARHAQVIFQRFGRESEVDKHVARLTVAAAFDVRDQTKFFQQRFARRRHAKARHVDGANFALVLIDVQLTVPDGPC